MSVVAGNNSLHNGESNIISLSFGISMGYNSLESSDTHMGNIKRNVPNRGAVGTKEERGDSVFMSIQLFCPLGYVIRGCRGRDLKSL